MVAPTQWDDPSLADGYRLIRGVHRILLVKDPDGKNHLKTSAFRYDPPEKSPGDQGCSVQCGELLGKEPVHPGEHFSWDTHCAAIFPIAWVREPIDGEQPAGVIQAPVETDHAHCLIRVRDECQRKRWWDPVRAGLVERSDQILVMSVEQADSMLS